MNFDKNVIYLLLNNEFYFNKVIPYIDKDLFESNFGKYLFDEIKEYLNEFDKKPSFFTLESKISETLEKEKEFLDLWEDIKTLKLNNNLKDDEFIEQVENYIELTEKKFKQKKLEKAIVDSVEIIQDKKKKDKSEINKLIEDALSLSFETSLGIKYEDFDKRWEEIYNVEQELRIKTGIKTFDNCLNGGWKPKTLNFCVAGPGGHKTEMLCNLAANNIRDGKKVLYITLEISEEELSQRIDATVLKIPIHELTAMKPEKEFKKKVGELKPEIEKWGSLIIKEYPDGEININHIKKLLNELKFKEKFIPDVIYIDYLALMNSAKGKVGEGSYETIKHITVDMRGLAKKMKIPIISVHQLTREGTDTDSIFLKMLAESFAIARYADFVGALFENDTLIQNKMLGMKILKSRYKSNKGEILKFDHNKEYMLISDPSKECNGNMEEMLEQLKL